MTNNTIAERVIAFMEESDTFTWNIRDTSVEDAYAYASAKFAEHGKTVEDYYPDFENNYRLLQSRMEDSLDIPRIDMPVINPDEVDSLVQSINNSELDIYKSNKLQTASGKIADRINTLWVAPLRTELRATHTKLPVEDMKPSQSQIWLDKLIEGTLKYGIAKKADLEKATMISSNDGYILDGHHRYANAMLLYPDMQFDGVRISVNAKELIHILKTYSNALGKKPNL